MIRDRSTSLSHKIKYTLWENGVNSLLDVVGFSLRDLRRLNGVGPATIAAIRRELDARGLRFADESEADYIDKFSDSIASMLAEKSQTAAHRHFKEAIRSEFQKMRRKGVDMKQVACDDTSESNTVIILIGGKEFCRFSLSVKLTRS